jgi:hypothetical protein
MSFSTLLPYFRARLSVRHPELNEWADAFNVDNIPATKLGKAYHVELLPANYVGTAHVILAFRAQVRVRVFVKGYAKPEQAVDKATSYADSIIKECCKSRLTQPAIKNVLPISVDVKALALTNDNAAYLDLTFECNLMLNPDAP